MRKILFSLVTLAGMLFAFSSCEQAATVIPPDEGPGGSYVENGFTLSLTIPGTRANAYTTIAPVRTESDIYSLHLVFFEQTSNATGSFKGFYSVDIDEDSPLDIENPVDVRFEESSGLTNTEAYNILLVANLDWYLKGQTIEQWIASLPSMNEGQVIESTRAYVDGEDDETIYSDGIDRLPMSTSAVKEAYTSRVEVMLTRTVARIDINSYIGSTYDFVTASIWNAFPYSSIWEGTVDYSEARIQRYYGIRTEQSPNGQYNAIEGGLYAFDNYVEAPETNDRLTTCIIIGMRNLDPTASDYNKTLYYRINLHQADMPHELKRNNSYNITVRGVLDKGYPTELEAYLGEADKLDIVINYWDLDDGIIMYDGDNILAVPVKRINIPREGDQREYSIFTFGNGSLALTRNTVPAGIDVRLDGNMLYVNSDALPVSETSRSGEIDLTFGTLKATVVIAQGGDTGNYLELSPASLTLFPAYGSTTSETVTVLASGPWTAKIYNEGFSFQPGSSVTEISSANGDSFTVSTVGSNHDNSSRLGFVVVSLDDKTEVNRSIVLQQRGQSGITVTPEQDLIYFLADGSVHPSSNNTFRVDPGDNGYGVINPWTVELASDEHFYISARNYDPANASGNTFTVSARSSNTTVNQRASLVNVFITDEPSVNKAMSVLQIPYSLSLSQKVFDVVPAAGGTRGPVRVTTSAGTTWSASIQTTTDGNGHSAKLVGPDGTQVTQLSGMASSQSFQVVFPRLTTPNISPAATITVTLEGADLKESFTISQTSLVPRALHVNSKGTSYATLDKKYTAGYNYINVFGNNLYNPAYFGNLPNSVVKTAGTITYGNGYSKTLDSKITQFHANQGCHSYRKAVVEWLKRDHRNFLTMSLEIDQADQQTLLRLLSSSYTVKSANIKTTVKRSLSQTPQVYRNTKVWEYLVKTGPFTNGVELNIDNTAFYNGDATNGCLSSWPSTTIPIIMHPTNSSYCQLALDPVHKVLIIGDTEMFCNRNTASNKTVFTEGSDNWKFLNNLLAFIVNAQMYGDDFLNEFR